VKRSTKIAAGGVGGVLAIGLIVGVANGGSDSSGGKPPSPPTAAAPKTPSAVPPKQAERADLKSFTLDDRSRDGINDIWVKWTITNHSSKKSDYAFDWEAVSKDSGIRVANSTELVTNVLPGQTVKGDDFTTLQNVNVTLHITKFDRTQAY
jgi:hypothetical protein